MDWGPQAEDQLQFLKEQSHRLRAHYCNQDDDLSEDFMHGCLTSSPRPSRDENQMEEIITDYIVSASHLDQLRANRGEVGAILDAAGSRSPGRDDPFSPGRGVSLAAKSSPTPASLATAGGGGGGGG
eukprot:CAMPEP_0172202726 /NCGR_PEP_ID=MMETSP1050-20130122/30838_1 /TAXON_ID=233186 /ORGANISM="Cryptomonas curvata, Strain CCAP979/52" /LENGTH=126 /DNA_ID=CAMNT_0012880761 /DNA_START=152 /DNA_END=528 /DNA_ORIENTATION=+